LIQFSATSGEGKDEIWQALRQVLGVDQ